MKFEFCRHEKVWNLGFFRHEKVWNLGIFRHEKVWNLGFSNMKKYEIWVFQTWNLGFSDIKNHEIWGFQTWKIMKFGFSREWEPWNVASGVGLIVGYWFYDSDPWICVFPGQFRPHSFDDFPAISAHFVVWFVSSSILSSGPLKCIVHRLCLF